MFIEQLYTGCLAEAAYYIESEGEVVIIDPLRETEPYLNKLKERNHKLKYIFETHFHADFVSGHVDLAKATGAEIVFGPDAKTLYKSTSAKDGQVFTLGKITITVLHTPGHTLESSCYLLKDETGKPCCVFTGDTLFIGDVGRPDLAQASSGLTDKDLAGMLYDSLHAKLLTLPDDVTVYPAHGAGSACGKHMSKETVSSIGNQKLTNYALKAKTREEFIEVVTDGILPPPRYFAANAGMNKSGYEVVDEVIARGTCPLSVAEVKKAMESNALILDTRKAHDFVDQHISGSQFIGIDGSFAVWAASILEDLQTPVVIVADPGREKEVATRLARVGCDFTLGYLDGGLAAWIKAGEPVDRIDSVQAHELHQLQNDNSCCIVDVRKPGEHAADSIESALNFPLDFIHENWSNYSSTGKYYLHCAGGYRSVIAASFLRRKGIQNVIDISGGFSEIAKTDISRKSTKSCTA